MNSKLIHFSKFLGKKILHENREYILHAVSLGYLLVLDGTSEPTPKVIDECKIIANSQEEIIENNIPPELAVIKKNNKYTNADLLLGKSDEEIENDILDTICDCAGITRHELATFKSRRIEFRQSRQIHMTIKYLLIRNKKDSLSKIGAIYGLDHATVLHAIEKVQASLNGFDDDFKERFHEVWEIVEKHYPDRADKNELNLKWL
jgi:hypothetical protein